MRSSAKWMLAVGILVSANAMAQSGDENAADNNAVDQSQATPATVDPAPAPVVEAAPAVETTPPVVATEPAETALNTQPQERVWHIGAQAGLQILPMYKVGIEGDYTKAFSFGAGYGFFSFATKAGESDATYSAKQMWLEGRWHPFQGSFFMGAALGQTSSAISTDAAFEAGSEALSRDVNTEISLTFSKNYLAPKFGWLGRWDSGFIMGTDFGWQIPLGGVKSEFEVEGKTADDKELLDALKQTDDYKKQKDDVESLGDTLGKKLALEWNVIKIGWMF